MLLSRTFRVPWVLVLAAAFARVSAYGPDAAGGETQIFETFTTTATTIITVSVCLEEKTLSKRTLAETIWMRRRRMGCGGGGGGGGGGHHLRLPAKLLFCHLVPLFLLVKMV